MLYGFNHQYPQLFFYVHAAGVVVDLLVDASDGSSPYFTTKGVACSPLNFSTDVAAG